MLDLDRPVDSLFDDSCFHDIFLLYIFHQVLCFYAVSSTFLKHWTKLKDRSCWKAVGTNGKLKDWFLSACYNSPLSQSLGLRQRVVFKVFSYHIMKQVKQLRNRSLGVCVSVKGVLLCKFLFVSIKCLICTFFKLFIAPILHILPYHKLFIELQHKIYYFHILNI